MTNKHILNLEGYLVFYFSSSPHARGRVYPGQVVGQSPHGAEQPFMHTPALRDNLELPLDLICMGFFLCGRKLKYLKENPTCLRGTFKLKI